MAALRLALLSTLGAVVAAQSDSVYLKCEVKEGEDGSATFTRPDGCEPETDQQPIIFGLVILCMLFFAIAVVAMCKVRLLATKDPLDMDLTARPEGLNFDSPLAKAMDLIMELASIESPQLRQRHCAKALNLLSTNKSLVYNDLSDVLSNKLLEKGDKEKIGFLLGHTFTPTREASVSDVEWSQIQTSVNKPTAPQPEATEGAATSDKAGSSTSDTSQGIDRSLDTDFQMAMGCVGNWGANLFQLQDKLGINTLAYLGEAWFAKFGLLDGPQMNRLKLQTFLMQVAESYPANAYHNALHAADVLQTVGCLIQDNLFVIRLKKRTILGSLLSAIIHDVNHPGINNNYLINTQDPLSIMYNDRSILENMHLSTAFKIMLKPECNFLEGMSKDEFKKLRAAVIELVLATDLATSFEKVGKWTAHVKSQKGRCDDGALFTLMCLKCADLSHPTKPAESHYKWTELITVEFHDQGDKEKEKGIPISPLCNRQTDTDLAKSQIGFIDFVVRPVFEAFTSACNAKLALQHLSKNYTHWKQEKDPNWKDPRSYDEGGGDIESAVGDARGMTMTIGGPRGAGGVNAQLKGGTCVGTSGSNTLVMPGPRAGGGRGIDLEALKNTKDKATTISVQHGARGGTHIPRKKMSFSGR